MLTVEEENLVVKFSHRIAHLFPGEINKVLIYGSKARGDDREDSDIDILVITSFDDWRKADEIRACGYSLDLDIGSRFSIQVMSKQHFSNLQKDGFGFAQNVERDGIQV